MATTAHYLYSDYRPEDKERLEAETGQLQQDSDDVDPWLTEKTFGSSQRLKNPPRFVAATINYDPWIESSSQTLPNEKPEQTQTDVASWYKKLTSANNSSSNSPKDGPSRALTPVPATQLSDSTPKSVVSDKSTWFIRRALETQLSVGETSCPSSSGLSTPPTLADLLSREPPPLPSQKPFEPPVWIALGPSNKGFNMLQKGGWEEGEALGKHAVRRQGLGYKPKQEDSDVEPAAKRTSEKVRGKRREDVREIVVATGHDDIEEVKRVDVVDLTVSDDDSNEVEVLNMATTDALQGLRDQEKDTDIDHNPRALLTPLPTILKSDRLGIGLKAKTVGPYRESAKKVTHSQAALAAHAASNEERRRLKAMVGRGRRGYDRVRKKDEGDRKRLLAYLNAD